MRTRETAVALFSKQKNLADTAQELRAIYQGGNGFTTEAGSFAVWYTDDGIRLARGRQARYMPSAQLVPWETAAERVEAMLHAGTFAPQSELDAALGHERDGVALRLDYLCGDFTEEARSAGYLASISDLVGLHHPDSEQKISELLADPKSRASITQDISLSWHALSQSGSTAALSLSQGRGTGKGTAGIGTSQGDLHCNH